MALSRVCMCVLLFVALLNLDLSGACRVQNNSHPTICLPVKQCPKSSQLVNLNRFCNPNQVCCLKSSLMTANFRTYSVLSKYLLRQDKGKITHNNLQGKFETHSLYKRAEPAQIFLPNRPLYMYPFPLSRQNIHQRRLGFSKTMMKPVEDKLNTDDANRILNKNGSLAMAEFYFRPPLRRPVTTAYTTPLPHKDSVVFKEKEYQQDDPIAENIKRNFERYQKDVTNLAQAIKFSDIIDERVSNFGNRPGVKSAQYCKDYETYVTNRSQPLRFGSNEVLIRNGKEKNHCSRMMPLIVGGLKALSGEFPHMAGLGFDRGHYIEFLCGGSLISPSFVLTAAHCAKTKWGRPIMVRLGVNNIIHDEGQNMDIEHIIVHPEYKPPACYNDIALIKIVGGLRLGPNLRPACLPSFDTSSDQPSFLATATGWGRTGYGKFSSESLLKVTLQIISNQDCENSYTKKEAPARLGSGIVDTMLCAAGYLKSSDDTCQGDSGGPLQSILPDNECMFQVRGVTSFGKICGSGLPGVYTRVSAYIPWIEEIVWPS